MTAVAAVPPFQKVPRNVWPGNNTEPHMNIHDTSSGDEDLSRTMLPRKSAQRSNSSSSISTVGTTNTTLTATQAPDLNSVILGDASWNGRNKKQTRGLWPPTKAEPVLALSTVRPQPTVNGSATPAPLTPVTESVTNGLQQGNAQNQWPQNGLPKPPNNPEHSAILHLLPINGTFDSKTISVPLAPDILRIGRQTNQKTVPTPSNGYFDSKVLSRQHAEIWADRDGKIWIRDVKSSNGTFVNGKRLSQENRDSEPHLLKEQDVLELGIDIVSEDQKTVVHHKVAARVEHAGFYGLENNVLPLNIGEMDVSSAGGVAGPLLPPSARNRSGSQGSNNSNNSRFAVTGPGLGPNSMVPTGYHGKWLQPISMEQIVKRINFELRNARNQSSDLYSASSFVDAVCTVDKSALPSFAPTKITSPAMSFDPSRPLFIPPPPAPPPTQPLPEAPSDGGIRAKRTNLPGLQPMLRRSETERPKSATFGSGRSSPTKHPPASQIRSVVEALNTAQKEISSQNEKIRDVEETLQRERQERKSAEENLLISTPVPVSRDSAVDIGSETDATRLQSLVDTMRAEMEEMKMQMERYRQRADGAEEKSQHDRQKLADMVESIRQRDELLQRRRVRQRRAGTPTGSRDREIANDEELDELNGRLEAEIESVEEHLNGFPKPPSHLPNGSAAGGSTISVVQLQELGKAAFASVMSVGHTAPSSSSITGDAQPEDEKKGEAGTQADNQKQIQLQTQQPPAKQLSRAQEQFVQNAPYASLIGVVLLGVGMMAYLNGWQKVVDR